VLDHVQLGPALIGELDLVGLGYAYVDATGVDVRLGSPHGAVPSVHQCLAGVLAVEVVREAGVELGGGQLGLRVVAVARGDPQRTQDLVAGVGLAAAACSAA